MINKNIEDKISLENKAIKNKVIFLGKYKGLVIQPYLTAQDINTANIVCVDQFLSEIEDEELTRYDIFPNVKIAYDLHVIHSCTNLDYESTLEVYDNLVSSGLVDYVTKNIKNYDSTWSIILESIKLRNTFIGLNLIENRIPDTKEFDKSINEVSKAFTKLDKENPTLLKKIAETAMYQGVVDNINERNKPKTKSAKAKKEAEIDEFIKASAEKIKK